MSFYRTRNFLQRERIPVTIALVAASAILFLADFFTQDSLATLFFYHVQGARLASPIWTPLAYPLLTPNILSVLFGLMSMWWVGGSLERSWGSGRFAAFFFGVTLLGALLVWLGALVLRSPGALLGIWPPVAALTAAWASINPDEQVTFNFVFKMRSRWLALIIVLVTYFIDFAGQPLVGLFWLLCPVAAWYYVRGGLSVGRPLLNRRPPPKGPDLRFSTDKPKRETSGNGPFAKLRNWKQDREQRRRLQELWRNSGLSDKDDRKHQ